MDNLTPTTAGLEVSEAQLTLSMLERADVEVSAYIGVPVRYVKARRDAALLLAADPLKTDKQVAYWNRIADGCAAIIKSRKKVAGLDVTELSGAEALDAINGRLKLDVPHIKGERVIEMRGTVPADWTVQS